MIQADDTFIRIEDAHGEVVQHDAVIGGTTSRNRDDDRFVIRQLEVAEARQLRHQSARRAVGLRHLVFREATEHRRVETHRRNIVDRPARGPCSHLVKALWWG